VLPSRSLEPPRGAGAYARELRCRVIVEIPLTLFPFRRLKKPTRVLLDDGYLAVRAAAAHSRSSAANDDDDRLKWVEAGHLRNEIPRHRRRRRVGMTSRTPDERLAPETPDEPRRLVDGATAPRR
jgi:hypothetical protein